MKHIRTSRVISPPIAAVTYACPKPAFHAVAAGQLHHRIAVSLLVALLRVFPSHRSLSTSRNSGYGHSTNRRRLRSRRG